MIKIKRKTGGDTILDNVAAGELGGESMPDAMIAAIRLPEVQSGGEPAEREGTAVPHPQLTWSRGIAKEHHEKAGWFSPVYHTSRAVSLDAAHVAANCCLAFQPDASEMECYKVVRSQILRHIGMRGGVTIMVTSALPGEGKTTTAINLSCAFAQEFMYTVLLVDCDLRQQKIHEALGFQSERGVVDHLLDDCPIPEVTVWPGIEKMTVISGGKKTSSGSELLASPRMRTLAAELRDRYPERYVIFDAPPLLAGADALALVPLVDYVLVVARAGSTSQADIVKAANLIPREKMLGLALNRERDIIRRS
jgi:non-specific protein-tyrosine kinase